MSYDMNDLTRKNAYWSLISFNHSTCQLEQTQLNNQQLIIVTKANIFCKFEQDDE